MVTHRDDPNRFHRYVEEILLVEGYPWFRVHDLADDPPDPTALRAAAVVVVAAVTLTAEQEEELAALTAAGARVLLLRPGHRLARAFGLERAASRTGGDAPGVAGRARRLRAALRAPRGEHPRP